MCKVIVKKPKENVGFILYNHLCSRENGTFTIEEIVKEMKGYHLCLKADDIRCEVNKMVKEGIVIRNYGSYTKAARI